MEYLEVKSIAKYLACSKETIYRWVKAGYIPVHTVGKKHLFCKEEIDLWVLSHSVDYTNLLSEEEILEIVRTPFKNQRRIKLLKEKYMERLLITGKSAYYLATKIYDDYWREKDGNAIKED